jgi:hypothetical protein
MGKFLIDSSLFPLLFVKYPQETTAAEIDTYLGELYILLKRGKVFSIVDLTNVATPNSLIRAYMAKKLDALEKDFPNNVTGEAIIAPSTFQRGLVTAHLWLRSNKHHPMKVFADLSGALVWAHQILADHGLRAG